MNTKRPANEKAIVQQKNRRAERSKWILPRVGLFFPYPYIYICPHSPSSAAAPLRQSSSWFFVNFWLQTDSGQMSSVFMELEVAEAAISRTEMIDYWVWFPRVVG